MSSWIVKLCLGVIVMIGIVVAAAGSGAVAPSSADTAGPPVAELDDRVCDLQVADNGVESLGAPAAPAAVCDDIACMSTCRSRGFCEGQCIGTTCRCLFPREDFADCP